MFRDYFSQQIKLHPSMQPQDIIKLCYQAAFGAEHLLGDIERVKGYFDEEFSNIPEGDGPLVEFISGDVCRVNLAAWKKLGLTSEWLFNLFVLSAGVKHKGGEKLFWRYLSEALPSRDDWPDVAKPVHHSNIYRENEKPSYRVISGEYVRLLPILERIDKNCAVIAIDGRAASGKSTMASQLSKITGASVVHMDDFFLPKELRTVERLETPGGNFHHERFSNEVLPFLRSGNALSYKIFDCSRMDFNGVREVAKSPLRILEGAYSCHPILEDYMDLRVFSDITPQEQHARIKKRNGTEIAADYANKWIPMEEEYLQFHQIKNLAQVIAP